MTPNQERMHTMANRLASELFEYVSQDKPIDAIVFGISIDNKFEFRIGGDLKDMVIIRESFALEMENMTLVDE